MEIQFDPREVTRLARASAALVELHTAAAEAEEDLDGEALADAIEELDEALEPFEALVD